MKHGIARLQRENRVLQKQIVMLADRPTRSGNPTQRQSVSSSTTFFKSAMHSVMRLFGQSILVFGEMTVRRRRSKNQVRKQSHLGNLRTRNGEILDAARATATSFGYFQCDREVSSSTPSITAYMDCHHRNIVIQVLTRASSRPASQLLEQSIGKLVCGGILVGLQKPSEAAGAKLDARRIRRFRDSIGVEQSSIASLERQLY